MRRALIVGIDNYSQAPLAGCIKDAEAISKLLECHHDESPNFACRLVTDQHGDVNRRDLKEKIEDLFKDEAEMALFYFAGHGTENNLGGYLVTSDAEKYDEGISMTDVLILVNNSKVREVVIILDCCHSGHFGNPPELNNDKTLLREGVTILTATRSSQGAVEIGGRGLFTSLVCDALQGGSADIVGDVTVASIYAYADQVLGAWDQRPLFKSHVSKLTPVRRAKPKVVPNLLRFLPLYFKTADTVMPLDPSYEDSVEPRNLDNERIFGHLQLFRDARLLIPVGEQHLYYAAINSKACCLTELGKFYWRLAKAKRI